MTVAVQLDLLANAAPKAYPHGIPPDVCDLFEAMSLQVIARGFERYSARAVLHQMRWHHHIERGDREYRLNDHWTPILARWFISRHPDKAEFFELRESPRKEH